jgi:N-acetyl sugar amidotransferase
MTGDFLQCAWCLYRTNHPFGLTLDAEGVCSGCRVHEEKDNLDWVLRFQELKKLTSSYKLKGSQGYDCIVPVTGGQDTFFIVHTVIYDLGLNPLLVNFNRNFNSAVGIKNLATLRTVFQADFRQFTINPKIARKVVRTTLANLGTVNWLSIAGQTSYPVRLASELGIPLIIWGAHQGVEQVGMFSHIDEVEMTSRYRKEHDLMGVDENSIFKFNPDFSPSDIVSLVYPSDDSLQRHGIRGIYLSNFLRWDPVAQHGFVREKYGYHGRKASRSYYEYDNPDCPVYLGFQDLLKEKRLGYGKVTDQLVRDIRHKRIDKSTALAIEREYLGQTPQGITKFADWLGVPLRNLDTVLLANANDFANQILTENWRGGIVDSDAPIELLEDDQKCLLDQDFINIGKGL